MPLTCLSTGNHAIITRISGTDSIRNHLQTLGLIPGTRLEFLGKNPSGVIVNIRNSTLSLDIGTAKKIQCSLIANNVSSIA